MPGTHGTSTPSSTSGSDHGARDYAVLQLIIFLGLIAIGAAFAGDMDTDRHIGSPAIRQRSQQLVSCSSRLGGSEVDPTPGRHRAAG